MIKAGSMYDKKLKKKRAMQKKGMLSGGQAKLDKNKNNKIDAEDFKILRSEKAKGRGMGLQDEKMKPGKVKPVKAVLGLATMGLLGAKFLKDRKKRASKVAGKGSALGAAGSGILSGKGIGDVIQRALRKQSKGGVMKAREGEFVRRRMLVAGKRFKSKGMGTATDYQKYLKGLKKATTKPNKTSKLMSSSSEFLKRRGITDRALKAAKATRIGKIAAGVAGAALLGKAALEKAYEKRTGKKPFTKRPDKKMGGGMMKRPMGYTKGGGADTGTAGEARSKRGVAINKLTRAARNIPKNIGTQSAIKRLVNRIKGDIRDSSKTKMMGGGMMQKPMMAKKGKAVMIVIGMKPKKKMGGGLMAATEKLKAQGKMGGGMMQRPMMAMGGGMMPGYKKGKSVMAKGCKLGRKKATKMYT